VYAGWFAPAAACLLLACVILNPRSAVNLSDSSEGGLVTLVLSNQSYASYLPGSFKRTHNQLETLPEAMATGLLASTNLLR